ncbi:MAG: hypothetical protein H0W73_14965 [Bacteroidetes bacterium]|nr:hypothetical protein [Bacteroidota bacterium]
MSATEGNKEQNGQKAAETSEDKKDWMDYIQDFIKNPITTGVTGLAAGYLLGTFKASKDIDALKAEHKQQMTERDQQFNQMLRQIKLTHKLIASQKLKTLPENEEEQEEEDEEDDENTLHLKEDKKTKVYKYQVKKKKQFEIK